MLFYRSTTTGRDVSTRAARMLSLASLIAYPAGAVTLLLGDGLSSSIAGYGLILLSLMCVGALMRSSVQRIVGEQADQLDEYELQLRYRAVSSAYTCLAVLILLALIYGAIASDKGGWVPTSYDEFNGLFWGAFLYASMLPTLFLAWRLDAGEEHAQSTR